MNRINPPYANEDRFERLTALFERCKNSPSWQMPGGIIHYHEPGWTLVFVQPENSDFDVEMAERYLKHRYDSATLERFFIAHIPA